jgi:hypothetical protein
LNKNWQKYYLDNENSLSSFAAKKILEYNVDVRDCINNYEDKWERIYVPVICQKYNNIRGDFNSEIRKQYFGDFVVCKN